MEVLSMFPKVCGSDQAAVSLIIRPHTLDALSATRQDGFTIIAAVLEQHNINYVVFYLFSF